MVVGIVGLLVAHPVRAEEPVAISDDKDFVSLFNGRNMDGWVGGTNAYVVEDGALVSLKEPVGKWDLSTEKEYTNFVFRFEFKLTPHANNGIGIRGGAELQMLDNSSKYYKDFKPDKCHGALFGLVPAKRGALKPVGEWNSQEVLVDGNHVKVILNGTVILDCEIDKIKPSDVKQQQRLRRWRSSGPIKLLGHKRVVWFRHLRIKLLP